MIFQPFMIGNKEVKNTVVLAESPEQVKWKCDMCGAMMKVRPFLCRCRSNVFIHPHNP